MNQSTIKIDVLLDPNKVPEQISWQATDSSADMAQKAKAMCIAFWDEKSSGTRNMIENATNLGLIVHVINY